jgi:hypothetical protein
VTSPEYCVDLRQSLAINRSGTWTDHGSPISHVGLCEYLNRSIRYDSEGGLYYLRSGKGKAEFSYDETPLIIRVINFCQHNATLQLNTEAQHAMNPDCFFLHSSGEIVYSDDSIPMAWLSRSAFYCLSEHVTSDNTLFLGGKERVLQAFTPRSMSHD